MITNRLFLLLTALVFISFGLWGLLRPAEMLARFGVDLADPAGRTAIRAMYGGFLMGAGSLFAFAALAARRVRFGLQAVLILCAAILASRLSGAVLDGPLSAHHGAYAFLEALGAGVSLYLLVRTPVK